MIDREQILAELLKEVRGGLTNEGLKDWLDKKAVIVVGEATTKESERVLKLATARGEIEKLIFEESAALINATNDVDQAVLLLIGISDVKAKGLPSPLNIPMFKAFNEKYPNTEVRLPEEVNAICLNKLTAIIARKPNSASLEEFKDALSTLMQAGFDPRQKQANSLLNTCLLNPTEQNFEIFKYLVEQNIVKIEDQISASNAFDCQNMPDDQEGIKKFLDYIDANTTDEQKNKCQLFNLSIYFNYQELFGRLLANDNIDINSLGGRGGRSSPINDIVLNGDRGELAKAFISSDRFEEAETGRLREDSIFQAIIEFDDETFDLYLSKVQNYSNFNAAVQATLSAASIESEKASERYVKCYNAAQVNSFEVLFSKQLIMALANPSEEDKDKSTYAMLLFLNKPSAIDMIFKAADEYNKRPTVAQTLQKLLYILECVRDLKGLNFAHIANSEHKQLLSSIAELGEEDRNRLAASLNVGGEGAVKFFNDLRTLAGGDQEAISGIMALEEAVRNVDRQQFSPIVSAKPISCLGENEPMIDSILLPKLEKAVPAKIFEDFIKLKPEEAIKKLGELNNQIPNGDKPDFYKRALKAMRAIRDKDALSKFEQKLEGYWLGYWAIYLKENPTPNLEGFKKLYEDSKAHGMNPSFAVLGDHSRDTSLIIELLVNPNEHTLGIIKYLVEEEKLDVANLLSSRHLKFNPQTPIPGAEASAYAKEILDYLDEKLPTAEEKNKAELLHLAIYFGHTELFDKLLNDKGIDIAAEGLRGDPPIILLGHHTDRAELLDKFIAHERFNSRDFEKLGDPSRIIVSLCQYGSDSAWNGLLDKLKDDPKFGQFMSDALLQMNFKSIDNTTKEADKEWLGRMPARVKQVFQVAKVNSLVLLENPFGTNALFTGSHSSNPIDRLKLDLLIINDPRVIGIFNKAFSGYLEGEDPEVKNRAAKAFGFDDMAIRLTYLKIINQHNDIDYKKIANDTHLKFFEFLINPDDLEIEKLVKNLDVEGIEGFCNKLERLTAGKEEYKVGIDKIREQLLDKVRPKSFFEAIYDFIVALLEKPVPILSSDPMSMAKFMGAGERGQDNSMELIVGVNEIAKEVKIAVPEPVVEKKKESVQKGKDGEMILTPFEISDESLERLEEKSKKDVKPEPWKFPEAEKAQEVLKRARKHTDKLKAPEDQKKNWKERVSETSEVEAPKER